MGRNRSYDEDEVLGTCARAFLQTGYEGTSIDDLVTATGLHRGSLYQAFGSKRGIFVAVLSRLRSAGMQGTDSVDLVLVALLELAPRDTEVRQLVAGILSEAADLGGPDSLGARLLARAHIASADVREGNKARRS